MTNYTARFDAAYEYVSGFARPVDLTPALGFDAIGTGYSLAAGEGIHIDEAKRPTAKAIGFMATTFVSSNAPAAVRGKILDRVELYRDAKGEVVPNFTGRADIYTNISDVNYGYSDKEFVVPEQSRELALSSALTAIEQAIEAHKAFVITS